MLAERLPRVAPVTIQGTTDLAGADAAFVDAPPDLLLIDPRPDLDRAEHVIYQFVSLPRPPRVIVYTSFLHEAEQRRLRDAGASVFVMKEPRLLNLLAAIQSVWTQAAP